MLTADELLSQLDIDAQASLEELALGIVILVEEPSGNFIVDEPYLQAMYRVLAGRTFKNPVDMAGQRTKWVYIFGAICPAKGKGAGLVMPWCDIPAMELHLAEISKTVDPGAHAVVIVDQAGWHLSARLAIPDNITLMPLPSRAPELNPVENIWQFMRDNWLSNRIFKSYDDIVALCCEAWNKLIERPWKITSIGMRRWAHGF